MLDCTRTHTPLVPACRYTIPPASAPIDPKLLLGAVLFGLGLGGSGLCPGPDIVNVAAAFTPQVRGPHVWVWVVLGGAT